MRFAPVKLLTNGNMAGSLNSFGEDVNQIFMFSIQAVFTGAPNGTLKIQVSNDDVPVGINGQDPAVNVVNWVDYTGSSQTILAAGNFMYIVAEGGYRWVRLVYTASSGSGTLNVVYNGKGA